MKNFEEDFYKILINQQNFYMKQYYSNFHKKEMFFAVKELPDGLYCALISNDESENIDYLETIEYIKTLERPFSLNIIILSSKEYISTENSSRAHKLIINKENYKVIECDQFCVPLKQIFENIVQANETNVKNENKKFLQYKILTFLIIGINIIVYLITAFLSKNIFDINSKVLYYSGALIQHGEIWRLLTCAFLHANLLHIVCNMYSLYIIGPQIEQIYGIKKYLSIYIISCITSSSLSYLMSSPEDISVGASGGIFGLMGALLAFAIIERHRIDKKSISSLMQVIIINLFIGLSIKNIENIDNFAHVGGLIGGLLVGYIIYRASKNKKYK